MSLQRLQLPRVIGHRGACAYAPENTLASLRKAYELGVSWIEFDAMLTQDGQPIIMHDESLERSTNGKGLVADTSAASIAQLDAGSWFSPQFAGEKIPSLQVFLAHAAQLGLGINVEIKPTNGKEIETAYTVVEVLQRCWSQPTQLLVSSFSPVSLALARALDESLPLGLLLDYWFAGWQEVMQQLNCVSVNVLDSLLSPEKVKEIKASGRYVLAFTVDDPIRAQELFSWGVDGVFSNRPDQLNKLT